MVWVENNGNKSSVPFECNLYVCTYYIFFQDVLQSMEEPVEISTLILTTAWPLDFTTLTTVTRSLINNLRHKDEGGPKFKITCAVLDQDGKIDMAHFKEAFLEEVKLKGMICPKGEEINLPVIKRINELSAAYYHHLFNEDSYHFIIGHAPIMAHGAVNLKSVCKDQNSRKVVLVIHGLPVTEQDLLNTRLLLSWIRETDIIFSIGEADMNLMKRYSYKKKHVMFIPIYQSGITPAKEGKRHHHHHRIIILVGKELGYSYIDLQLALNAIGKAAEQLQANRKNRNEIQIDVQILSPVTKIENEDDKDMNEDVSHALQDQTTVKKTFNVQFCQVENFETLKLNIIETDLLLLPLKENYSVFGTEALNAAVAGIPILVSEESGIAALLHDIEESEDSIIVMGPSRETEIRWADKIVEKLTDPKAFDKASGLRGKLLDDARIAKIHRNFLSAFKRKYLKYRKFFKDKILAYLLFN